MPAFQICGAITASHGIGTWASWIHAGIPVQPTTFSRAGFHAIICTTENIEKEIEAIKANGIDVRRSILLHMESSFG